MLKNKHIIVAVTGSVAAYKSLELIRELKRQGASVRVIATQDALHFVTPLSLQLASDHEVVADLFSRPLAHVDLPQWADVMVVAPATANTIAKFAAVLASDIVGACFLAIQRPVIVAPAMNWRMYTDVLFQDHLNYLKEKKGVIEVEPEAGTLACGEEGVGRMASLERIIEAVAGAVAVKDLRGRKIIVTAGPTREYLDPVRFFSNRSSGKMGCSLARVAARRGASVTLVMGPSTVPPPPGVKVEMVETALEMRDTVLKHSRHADVLIMAAAIADYAPRKREKTKLEKKAEMALDLTATPDIISEVAGLKQRPFIIGFAAETGDHRARAREKRQRKGMDIVVFNNVSLSGSGFDSDTNQVVLIDGGSETELPLMSKDEVAAAVLDRIPGRIS